MTERNIAGFPQRGVDLALERRIAEVARLAERVAELMETEDSPMSIRELFDRIESASADLSEIGMVLYGADRLKVQELCFNVRDMIDRTTPHTLVALAEAKHGVAIIPTQIRLRYHDLRIVGLTFNGKPVRERMMLLWDRRRPLPAYADAYCNMLAEHVRRVFPITRPSVRSR